MIPARVEIEVKRVRINLEGVVALYLRTFYWDKIPEGWEAQRQSQRFNRGLDEVRAAYEGTWRVVLDGRPQSGLMDSAAEAMAWIDVHRGRWGDECR